RAHAFGAGPCAWVLFGPRRLGPPLLPYTTLFRSDRVAAGGLGRRRELGGARRPLRAALRVGTPDPPLRDRLPAAVPASPPGGDLGRKSTRLNSSHVKISYAVLSSEKKSTATEGAR